MQDYTEEFRKNLAEIKEISTLPHVMGRIMEIVTDENSSASDLAAEIAKDTSLTAKILKMVNSAYYGFYRKIVKVSDAVVVLGFNEIRRLSLAISVLDMLGGTREKHRILFWNHSFTCAAMSDMLAKKRGFPDKGAFTAGLLHDIGISVLDQYFPKMFAAIQESMRERSIKMHEAERLLYGFDHADVGYWVSERWNLPVGLSEAIRYHHNPEAAEEAPELTQLVHVADSLANEFMEIQSRGLTVVNITDDGIGGFTREQKAELFLELQDRTKGATIASVLN